MFNLEIKRISLKSIVFSIYPFVVFVFALLSSLFAMGDLVDPEASLFVAARQLLLYSLISTAVIVFFSILAGFIYNLLASFGMRGLRISLTEVEETAEAATTEEASKEAIK